MICGVLVVYEEVDVVTSRHSILGGNLILESLGCFANGGQLPFTHMLQPPLL